MAIVCFCHTSEFYDLWLVFVSVTLVSFMLDAFIHEIVILYYDMICAHTFTATLWLGLHVCTLSMPYILYGCCLCHISCM